MGRSNFDICLKIQLFYGDSKNHSISLTVLFSLSKFSILLAYLEPLKLIEQQLEQKITVHILNLGILNLGKIEDTPTGRLIFTVFSAFADFERDLIVERTKEGKEIARQKPNYKDGRPYKYSKQQMQHAMQLLESYSYNQVSKMTGISKSTLLRHKRNNNHIDSPPKN
ncbi:recombinase family protein [Aerococcus urinaeequi]|uniref:recombinase family protein n=1 Tax=Aerococcus urinaeequi TaxID=51665 RepID=UPI003D6BD169